MKIVIKLFLLVSPFLVYTVDPANKDGIFQRPYQSLGLMLRDAFYLPGLASKVDPIFAMHQKLAEKISSSLINSEADLLDEYTLIRQFFSVRDLSIHLYPNNLKSWELGKEVPSNFCPERVTIAGRQGTSEDINLEVKPTQPKTNFSGCLGIEGPLPQIFTVRLFESKMPIAGKNLRIILFSFYGNSEVREGQLQQWNPLTIRALSESPLLILKAIKSSGIQVDSLMTTSLGNVALEGLKYLDSEDDLRLLPPVLIINRGMTSIWKVASQHYTYPLNYLLYGAFDLLGWNADPEQTLLDVLTKEATDFQHPQRTIILIEALKDFYFAEKAQFALDLHEKLLGLGHHVFRAKFYPFPYHPRSHHALTLDLLKNNSALEVLSDTLPLNLGENEKISSALAKHIFLNGEGEWHTCFSVGGIDATLDLGTVREVLPLLSAFIEEGQTQPYP